MAIIDASKQGVNAMGKYNNNFTVITSGGCNAKCSFCTDPMNYKASDDYIKNLLHAVFSGILPSDFEQCSISGGEPTISPDFTTILQIIKPSGRFNKVVLTTNGTKLLEHVDLIGKSVDHVNVSRHGVGYDKNVLVFKNKQIISDADLRESCNRLSVYGVDVNLNWVYSDDDNINVSNVIDYIEYAKSVSAQKVTFRHDQNKNTLEETELEKLFSGYRVIEQGGCPVCRSKTIIVNGMPVTFKSSFAEPSNTLGELYELIYHPSGKLTTDWEGKKEFAMKKEMIIPIVNVSYRIMNEQRPPRSTYEIGSRGCG